MFKILILILTYLAIPLSVYAIQNGLFVEDTNPILNRIVKLSNTCTGILIGEEQDTVLTAAHCLRHGWKDIIVYQYHDKFDHRNLPNFAFTVIDKRLYEARSIQDVRIKSFENSQEFALLKLKKSKSERKLHPMTVNSNTNKLSLDKNLFFAGFGPDFSKNNEQQSLNYGILPIYDFVQLPNHENEMLILGTENKRNGIQMACYGDSGGPVLYISNNSIHLVGIIKSILGTHPDFEKASTANETCKNELAEFLVVLPIDKNWLDLNVKFY